MAIPLPSVLFLLLLLAARVSCLTPYSVDDDFSKIFTPAIAGSIAAVLGFFVLLCVGALCWRRILRCKSPAERWFGHTRTSMSVPKGTNPSSKKSESIERSEGSNEVLRQTESNERAHVVVPSPLREKSKVKVSC
ncbi:hypothetical protein BJ170DRAFT_728649 [Xylariales sp. AK1849]|nr:hypothetical protein BJ170DRAFT_728649 [Xylariales sp. AK1849]